MPNEPRNEHEAWAALWATLDQRTSEPTSQQSPPFKRRAGPFTYHPPIAPAIQPLRAFLRLAGAFLIGLALASIPFT